MLFYYPEPQRVTGSTVQPNHSRVTKYQNKALQLKVALGFVKDSSKLDDGDKVYITRTICFSWRKYCIWSCDLLKDQMLNCLLLPLKQNHMTKCLYCHFSSTGGSLIQHFLQERFLHPHYSHPPNLGVQVQGDASSNGRFLFTDQLIRNFWKWLAMSENFMSIQCLDHYGNSISVTNQTLY